MDPLSAASIAFSLVDFSLQAYEFFETAWRAPEAATIQSQQVAMQKATFIAWCESWKIYDKTSNRPIVDSKSSFARYVEATSNKEMILSVLFWIQQIFVEAAKLVDQYGVRSDGDLNTPASMTSKELLPKRERFDSSKIEPQEKRMSFLTKIKYAFHGKEMFEEALERLREYNKILRDTCSPGVAEIKQINYITIQRMMSTNKSPAALSTLASAAATTAKYAETDYSLSHKPSRLYDNVAEIASLKSRAQQILNGPEPWLGPSRMTYGKSGLKWNNGDAELAVQRDVSAYRYIEWRIEGELHFMNDIKDTARILCSPNLPRALRFLKCVGIFKSRPDSSRWGLVYCLPDHVAAMPCATTDPKFWKPELRMPETLFDLLKKAETMPEMAPETMPNLLQRFKIAQKLVKSVILMHAAGWMHKNIRSSSILFLPKQSRADPSQPSSRSFKDLNKPYLTGFSFSRNDSEYLPPGVSQASHYTSRHLLNWKDDMYQYPLRRRDPRRRYTYAFDIYSLGCVLLEVGLWQSIDHLSHEVQNPNNYEAVADYFYKVAAKELPGQVGPKYANAVKACLGIADEPTAEEAHSILINKVAYQLSGLAV